MKKLNLYSLLMMILISSTQVVAMEMAPGTFALGVNDLKGSLQSSKFSILGTSTDTDTMTLSVLGDYYLQKNIGLTFGWKYQDIDDDDGTFSDSFTTTELSLGAVYNISTAPNMGVKLRGGFVMVDIDFADGTGIQLGTALNYYLNSSVSFDLGIQYKNVSLDDNFGNSAKIKDLLFGLVGITVYFK